MFSIIIAALSLLHVTQFGYGVERKFDEQQTFYTEKSNADTTSENYLRDSYGHILQSMDFYHSNPTNVSHAEISPDRFETVDDDYSQFSHENSMTINTDVEVTNPVPAPVYKHIGVPVANPMEFAVPHLLALQVPQPYPVHVPVAKPMFVPVVKTVPVPVEKRVPYALEKIIPVPIEKHIPITVEKYIPVPIEKPYPIHVPVYKHVFHRYKNHGWVH